MSNSRSWESDPLFSAAEVVQDSADRMESIYHILLHEQSLAWGNPSEPRLLLSLEYHRRDLVTALGTTKWQLEDFERAINVAALSDRSHLREGAVCRHRQFIGALREQVAQVEKILEESSSEDFKRNMHWVSLDKQDRDGLALFLSGSDPAHYHVHYESDSPIMRKFLDSTSASGFDDKSDEIVELKTEETDHLKKNVAKHADHMFDSFKEHKLRKVGSNYSTRLSVEAEDSGDKECETSCNGSGAWDLNVAAFKNRLKGSISKLDILGLLNNFWLASRSEMNRNFTKRRKDGEVTDDCILDIEGRPSPSALDMPQAEQDKCSWMGLISTSSCCGRLFADGWTSALQLCSSLGSSRRAFQRFQYFIQYNQFPIQLKLAIFLALILLGFMVLYFV